MSDQTGSERGVLGDENVASFQHLPAAWGEENVVRTLSRLMEGADWRDVFFESRAWANPKNGNG
jgi:hypothetical protein